MQAPIPPVGQSARFPMIGSSPAPFHQALGRRPSEEWTTGFGREESMVEPVPLNQVKSLPYGWALCGGTGESSPLSKKTVFLVAQNQRALVEFPSGKLNGLGVPPNNSLQNDAPQASRA
jgi:hypothetical protein